MATQPVPRLLLVVGDRNETQRLRTALIAEGWDARGVGTGQAAAGAAPHFRPHVAVVDMSLPDVDGLQVMRRLRDDQPNLPVLFLTAADGVEPRVRALSAGGDDCLTKPLFLPELISRLRALLRRTRFTAEPATLTVADLTLNEHTREVRRAGRLLDLTVTEFDLLRYLMANAGRVLPREQILERVWRFDLSGSSRMVEEYVARLRRKVDSGRRPLIHTIRGIGYILEHRERTGGG